MRMGEETRRPGPDCIWRERILCVAFWLRDPMMGQIADQARGEAIGGRYAGDSGFRSVLEGMGGGIR